MAGGRAASEKVVVAAAHAASVVLDKEACAAKAIQMIGEAATDGARLIVFPESFIPGFPLWCALQRPIDGHSFFRRLADNSPKITDSIIRDVANAAVRHRIMVSLGFSESSSNSPGCLWNSNILISENGELLNHHRKLVPTFYEKLVWSSGDGAGLRVRETPIGRIGSLICGENNNPLSRYALMAQGEQIHTASYPPVWPFRNPLGTTAYDLSDAIRVRAAAHSFEAKAFTIVSAGFLDQASIEVLRTADSKAEEILRASPASCSMIVGPNGDLRSEVITGGDALVRAEIDISEAIELKQHHDMAGYYNRLDVFSVSIDRARYDTANFTGPAEPKRYDLLITPSLSETRDGSMAAE